MTMYEARRFALADVRALTAPAISEIVIPARDGPAN
jgi:hypothetical protein